jgi:hypothetical protein
VEKIVGLSVRNRVKTGILREKMMPQGITEKSLLCHYTVDQFDGTRLIPTLFVIHKNIMQSILTIVRTLLIIPNETTKNSSHEGGIYSIRHLFCPICIIIFSLKINIYI